MKTLGWFLAIVFVATSALTLRAFAGTDSLFHLLKISDNELAITCSTGQPVVGKTPGGIMVVTCPPKATEGAH